MLKALAIKPEVHARRREAFMQQLATNSIAVIPANIEFTRSRDTEFAFRQNSDFQYLCGFPEPDAVLVLLPDDNKSVMFCRERDKLAEIWNGRRFGTDGVTTYFGIDEAHELASFDETLLELMNKKSTLYYARNVVPGVDDAVFDVIDSLAAAPKKGYLPPTTIIDPRPLTNEMRLFKSDEELAIMRKVGQISAEAHCRAMRFCQPGVTEYQLEAEIHHEFAMQGARYPSYGTIVGGGDNACILHYTENADTLNDGDLVLIDAGGELHGYSADITRTFPVNGQFSEPQKALYNLVLDAQLEALALCKPGNTLQQATDKAIHVITAGLVDLGLLSGDIEALIEDKAYSEFFMHGLGHWLGLDVHDVGDYKIDDEHRPLSPGMVFTVEPGIYVSPDADVDEQWKGIGIRIEDNVLITETGIEILTSDVPKSVEAIEALMAGTQK